MIKRERALLYECPSQPPNQLMHIKANLVKLPFTGAYTQGPFDTLNRQSYARQGSRQGTVWLTDMGYVEASFQSPQTGANGSGKTPHPQSGVRDLERGNITGFLLNPTYPIRPANQYNKQQSISSLFPSPFMPPSFSSGRLK